MATSKGSFQDKVNDFMRGRNGMDELGMAALALSALLALVNLFGRWAPLTAVLLLLLAYATFRALSTNVSARRNENESFCDRIGPARVWLRDPGAALEESRQYKHATCPNCHQRVRVPRGKGLVRITCPQCREKFEIRA